MKYVTRIWQTLVKWNDGAEACESFRERESFRASRGRRESEAVRQAAYRVVGF